MMNNSILSFVGKISIVFLFSCFGLNPSISAHPMDKKQELQLFRDWCRSIEVLPRSTQNILHALLEKANTNDCYLAEKRLNDFRQLSLTGDFGDLRPLASLKNIENLEVIDGSYYGPDIHPLSEMTKLTHLRIFGAIESVAPIANLRNLIHLDLQGDRIKDIQPLAALENLTYLNLINNPIQNMRPLANFKNLTTLLVSGGDPSSDLTPLSSLTKLTDLTLNGNCIDLSPLQTLTSLEVLHLQSTGTTDIKPLEKLTNLRELRLLTDFIRDIRPLAALKQLVELDLRETEIQDRAPLSQLPNLKVLRIDESLGLRHSHKRKECIPKKQPTSLK
jgi:internalin A